MSIRTYTIEARVDFEDSEKYDIFLEIMRGAARSAMASALLLRDRREPQIMLSRGDMFSKDEGMELIAPEEAGTPLEGSYPRGE